MAILPTIENISDDLNLIFKDLHMHPELGFQEFRTSKIVKEKLTKRNDVGDFVDDFKKSKAKQFRGKSAKKKKEMAVAAYLAKQNEK